MDAHLQPWARLDWELAAVPGPKASSVPFEVDQPASFADIPHTAQAQCTQ
jgi:hypothetical protein